jgi:hypothetical protein
MPVTGIALLYIGQGEARHKKIRDVNVAVARHMTILVIKLVLQTEISLIGHT